MKRLTLGGLNKIPEEIYLKGKNYLNTQKKILEEEIEKSKIELSNFHNRVDAGLELLKNLDVTWDASPLKGKIMLQKALFPAGLLLDSENVNYRTDNINAFVFQMHALSTIYGGKEKPIMVNDGDNSCLVVPTRIELVSKV